MKPIVIDAGILGEPQDESRYPAGRGGENRGKSLQELRRAAQKTSDRMAIIEIMVQGAAATVARLHRDGKIDGILSLGGSMGTTISARAMKMLPVGVPKLMVSTHFYPQYLGEADLTIMQSPTDIMGLNPVTNLVLSQAAGAICGMVEAKKTARRTRPGWP